MAMQMSISHLTAKAAKSNANGLKTVMAVQSVGDEKEKGRPDEATGRPRFEIGWLATSSALCGDGDNYNVTNYDTDQSTDGAFHIMVSAHVRNDFAVAIFRTCGDRDRGYADAAWN